MISTAEEQAALARASELEPVLAQVEAELGGLHLALRDRDLPAIEAHAADLQAALATAVQRFSHAARHGGVPQALRHRLAVAGAGVAAQRETLARATAALDRAIDTLLPGSASGLYGAQGAHEARVSAGLTRA